MERSRYYRLLVALGLAAWLLFWLFESLSPRMEAIAGLEMRLRGVTGTGVVAGGVVTGPLYSLPQGEP